MSGPATFTLVASTPPTSLLEAYKPRMLAVIQSLDQRTVFVSPSSSNARDASATLVLGAELNLGLYRLRV